MRILMAGLLFRIAIAFINSYFGPTLGAEGDALSFHELASSIANNFFLDGVIEGEVGWWYAYALGAVYKFTDPSLFLGCLLSCIAWLISGILLDKMLILLQVNAGSRRMALIVYAFLPSSLLFTSVTLREVYQLLFINLAIYSSLKIFIRNNYFYWIPLMLACIGMSYLHLGLLAYSIIIIGGTLLMMNSKNSRALLLKRLFIYVPASLAVLYLGLSEFMNVSTYNFDSGLATAVSDYRMGHNEARAMYAFQPKLDNFVDLLFFIPIALLQYLLEPFPWHISTAFDLALFAENCLRIIIIVAMLTKISTLQANERKLALFLFAMFFTLEIMWALGTVNWGSAARHHIPAIGLLVISAFYVISRVQNKHLS